MANRILTPSNVPNLFGAGKPGFGDDPNPLLATAFDASWCNGVQEELIRIIEYGFANGIGVPPNGAIFDQVLTVLKSMPFDGTVSLADGGTFTLKDSSTLFVEANGGNGGSAISVGGAIAFQSGGVLALLSGSNAEVQSGAMLDLKSGSTFTAESGSTVDFQESVTLATTKQLTLTGTAQVLGGLSATLTAGTIDTIDETGVVNAGGLDLYTDASPGAASGLVQWNGKRLSVGDGGALQVIRHPYFDYLISATTTAAGTDLAGLNITANVPPTQDVYITLDAHQFVDAVDGGLLRIRATNGVDSVTQLNLGDDDAAVSILPDAAVANQRRPNSIRVRWRPTNDFAVPANDVWTFFAQHGVNNLSNLKTSAATLMLQFL